MKTFIKIALLFFLITGLLSATLYVGLGFLVSLHSAKPEKADVIVVLGGDKGLRVEKGIELYKADYAKNILLTGIDSRYYSPKRLNWRERRLLEAGVPKRAMSVDIWSETTWEEAENTADLMEKKGWNSALVVSDPPHMLRLHKSWEQAFAGTSKQFILVATKPEWWHPLFWWRDPFCKQFVLNEIKKNIYYLLAYY